MQDPLKQGLKLCIIIRHSTFPPHSNARSIKTRIETDRAHFISVTRFKIRMQDPLKQGLKLSVARVMRSLRH